MMQLRTPVTERSKKTHTPPSGDRNAPSSSTKFLKDVTGKGLKKISAKLSRTPSSSVVDISSPEVEYIECFPAIEPNSRSQVRSQFEMFRRRPAPLNLQTLTPPSSIKKEVHGSSKSNGLLESPIDIKFGRPFVNPLTSLTSLTVNSEFPRDVQQEILSFHSDCFGESTLDVDDDSSFYHEPYKEESSPTYIMQMQRNMRKANGKKRYNSSSCSVCKESLQTLLEGERVLELECNHQCHMDCFLAMMNSTSFTPPACQICGKKSSPVDEQILQDLIVKKMTEIKNAHTNNSSGYNATADMASDITVQSITDSKKSSAFKNDLLLKKIQTPKDQLIRTAQLSANGFHDIFGVLDTPPESATLKPGSFISSENSLKKSETRVSINPKLIKYLVKQNSSNITLPHVISVHLPKQELNEKASSLQLIVCVSLINCDTEKISDNDYLKALQQRLRDILHSLSDEESLGMILVGKDGSDNICRKGTFYGFVSKSWDGWEEVIESLAVARNSESIFPNPTWEMKTALETADKLMTTAVPLEAGQIRHMIVVSGKHDVRKRTTTLEDFHHSQNIKLLMESLLNQHQCSISQWVSKDDEQPLFLQDYCPRWNYSVSTKFFHGDNSEITKFCGLLRYAVVDQLNLQIRSFNPRVVQFRTLDFNGSLMHCDKDSETLDIKLGPLSYGSFRSIILELDVDVKSLQQFIECEHAQVLSLEDYLSNGPNRISMVHYTTRQSNGAELAVRSGTSGRVTIDFHPTCSSPALSQTTSLFHVAHSKPAPANHNLACDAGDDYDDCHSDSGQFLDLPLVPPSTPSRDCIFVTRQIELMVVDSLRNLMHVTSTQNTEATIKELSTVLYSMSRDCVCLNPRYYQETGDENRLEHYIETLTTRLEGLLAFPSINTRALELIHSLI